MPRGFRRPIILVTDRALEAIAQRKSPEITISGPGMNNQTVIQRELEINSALAKAASIVDELMRSDIARLEAEKLAKK